MRKQLGIAAVIGGMFAVGSAQAIIIDDFSTDQAVVVSGAAPATASNNAVGGGMISADRDITVNTTAGPGNPFNTAAAGASGGVFGVSNGVTTESDVHVLWDGFAATDLTAGGATGFFLALPNPIDNTLKVDFNINGSASTVTKTFLNGAAGADFFIAFSDFSNTAVFTGVSSIEMVLYSTGPAWDAAVDLVETRDRPPQVPEPGTLGLIGLGLLGSMGLRRRKSA